MIKLDEAVTLDASRPDSYWWLGNAHTTRGFQTPDASEAGVSFDKAQECFRKAMDLVSRLRIKESPSVVIGRNTYAGILFDKKQECVRKAMGLVSRAGVGSEALAL